MINSTTVRGPRSKLATQPVSRVGMSATLTKFENIKAPISTLKIIAVERTVSIRMSYSDAQVRRRRSNANKNAPEAPIPAASVGLNAVLIYTHSGSTATGLSGVELDTTSDAPAADASNQLVILRAVNRVDNDTTITHANVEVMINQHTENQGTVGSLGI